MKWSSTIQTLSNSLIDDMRLPSNFNETVQSIYVPLIELILSRKQNEPLFISINGAQGTGKSTLTLFLKHLIEAGHSYRVAAFSLDDFYQTRKQREDLSKTTHPLLVTRGVPGTHDLELLERAVDMLLNGHSCSLPRFNKAIDDRYDKTDWCNYREPVDIILFEGWCNNSPIQTEQELVEPINELEANEDEQGIWRHYCNYTLEQYHARVFHRADMCLMLKAPDFEHIFEWRRLQEQKLRDNAPPEQHDHIMNDEQLKRFIQHYERISRHTLEILPDTADVVLPVANDHSITGIIKRT